MRNTKLALVAAMLLPGLALAGEPASDQSTLELTELVEAWIDAEVQDDRGVLEAILHENFLSTFASGRTMNRAEYIDFIISLDIEPFSVTNEVTQLFDDAAVVIDVSDDGQTKFTWIAIREEGSWRVIAQTFSGIE